MKSKEDLIVNLLKEHPNITVDSVGFYLKSEYPGQDPKERNRNISHILYRLRRKGVLIADKINNRNVTTRWSVAQES